jgi:hypothetical protein
MKALISMRQAISDPALFAPAFPPNPEFPDSWISWQALAIAARGEKLRRKEMEAFRRLTKRETSPTEPVRELVVLKSRRGGGTTFAATMVAYYAALIDYTGILGVGEEAVALLVAPTERQATVAFRRVEGLFDGSPLLSSMIVPNTRTKDSFRLNNGVTVEVRPASYKSSRGLTLCCCVVDEACFLSAEGKNTDSEIATATRPALLTTRGPLILASTPYAASGEVFKLVNKYFGQENDAILVSRSTWKDTNPTLDEDFIARELERDPVAARSEYFDEFRLDVSGFISRELLLAAVDNGVDERPPVPGIQYVAFCDAASGLGETKDGDRFAMAVGHLEGNVVVIDCCRRWMPPFNASTVTMEVAMLAKAYFCDEIISDGFSSGYLRSELLRHGVGHRITEFDKSRLYLATLPMLTSGRVRLPDLDFVVDEFAALERKPGSAGHDKIDNFRGHEDSANVCAGVIAQFAAAEPNHANNWLEFMRRQLVRGATDHDDIRVSNGSLPNFAFSFDARPEPENLITIEVPPVAAASSASIPIRGKTYMSRYRAGRAFIEVERNHAIYLLKASPAWRELNADTAADLMIGKEDA